MRPPAAITAKAPCLRASFGSLTIWNSGTSLARRKTEKTARSVEMVDGVVAPFVGGDHAAVEPEDLVEFAPVEAHRLVEAFASGLVERDQYCGCVPILRPAAVIVMPRSFEMNVCRPRLALSRCNCKPGEADAGGAPVSRQRPVTFANAHVGIGDASPHFCRFLSALMPQCPTNLPALPETVRSGTGS